MSLPLLHAGRTNPGLSAALDLRFALDKSLTAYRGPTPSFSRASTGSYFDGSGVLRYKGYNLCLNSENFSAASWSKTNISASFSSTELSPNGDLTASLVVPNTANNVHHINPSTFNGAASSYTLSIYAKNSGYPVLLLDANADVNFGATFNLATGTVTGTSGGSTATITSVGNGWYRCSITKESSFTFLIWRIYPNSSGVYSGDGSSGVLLWGAQVERTAILTDYSKTTSSANSAARFNHTYNGTSWVSRGLLVEEQRTNLATNSQEFNSGAYIKEAGSVSANTATAPDGTVTADKFIPSATNDDHSIYQTFSPSTYAISVFAKADGYNYLFIGRDNTAANYGAFFDLVNGTVSQNTSGGTTSIINVGNGWFRCSISMSAVQYALLATSENGTSFVHLGDGTKGVLLWGYQVESGSFPTSYIPTTSASSTRSADVCQITGSDFSGFWNGTEGSIVAEWDARRNSTDQFTVYWAKDAGSSNTVLHTGRVALSPPGVRFTAVSGASVSAEIINAGFPDPGVQTKTAGCYRVNDFAYAYNGNLVGTDTSGAVPVNPTEILIGSDPYSNWLNGHIARLRYYRKRLPNATLQLLSEPDPTLNLQFALNKTLTPVAGPAPSFSRASTGTYFNASGVLTSASINTPRFDHVYSGGQWVSRGLLVEEQRTNLALYSEDFSNAYYGKTNLTVSANDITSPDGTTTADRITATSTSQQIWVNNGLNTVNPFSGTCTVSFFIKKGTANFCSVWIGRSFFNGRTIWFDLTNKSYSTNTNTGGGYSLVGYGVSDVGNGWMRCHASVSGPFGDMLCLLYPALSASGTVTSVIGEYSYLWGLQIENASFPTSYIGTTSASATRSADVCQITGTSFNWMWNQGEGSIAVEFDRIYNQTSGEKNAVWFAQNSASPGSITMGQELYNGSEYFLSQADVAFSATPPAAGITGKSATGYKVNDYAFSLNGASALTDTVCTVPTTVDRLVLGNQGGYSVYLNGHIAKLIYYPARLTNTKLQQLST